jgi:hypothetical protein
MEILMFVVRKQVVAIFFSLLVIMVCSLAFAAQGAPQILNYQGNLTDAQGNPVNGSKTMSFRIYPTLGTPIGQALWASGDVSVPVVKGVFSVDLGAPPQQLFPPGLFADDTRYLGVSVDGTELQERKHLVSVPYALNAGSGVPKGAIIMWSGNAGNIPEGWALCDGTNGTPNLMDRFVIGAGNTYQPNGPPGGNATLNLSHSHIVASHTHGISADGNHSHSGTTGPSSHNGDVSKDPRDVSRAIDDHTHAFTTNVSGSHSHEGATGAQSPGTDAQLSSSQSILPPYYALCFIMKL